MGSKGIESLCEAIMDFRFGRNSEGINKFEWTIIIISYRVLFQYLTALFVSSFLTLS
jgi:hypothetical protein